VPAVVNRSGIRQVLDLDLNHMEQSAFLNSAAALKKVIKDAGL